MKMDEEKKKSGIDEARIRRARDAFREEGGCVKRKGKLFKRRGRMALGGGGSEVRTFNGSFFFFFSLPSFSLHRNLRFD